MSPNVGSAFPRLYYLPHRYIGLASDLPKHLDHCRHLGFDHVILTPPFQPGEQGDVYVTTDHAGVDPALSFDGNAIDFLKWLSEACRARELKLILEIGIDQLASEHRLVSDSPDCFVIRRTSYIGPIDPRRESGRIGVARAHFTEPRCADLLLSWWEMQLASFLEAGVAGFYCLRPEKAGAAVWQQLLDAMRERGFSPLCIASTYGLSWEQIIPLGKAGFNFVTSSLPWWDCRSSWLASEYEAFRLVTSVIAAPEAPSGPRLATSARSKAAIPQTYMRMLTVAATTGSGIMMPMGFEYAMAEPFDPVESRPVAFQKAIDEAPPDLPFLVRSVNEWASKAPILRVPGELRPLTGSGSPATALLRVDESDVRAAREALLILINPDPEQSCTVEKRRIMPSMGVPFGGFAPAMGSAAATASDTDTEFYLKPGEVLVLRGQRTKIIALKRRQGKRGAIAAATGPRIVIDQVSPAVRQGIFAVKRIVGETVRVEADLIIDGHEMLGAELQWRAADARDWNQERMTALGNDRWAGHFLLQRVGRYEFAIEAWLDRFGGFTRDLAKKVEARVDLTLDILEGRRMVEAARQRSSGDLAQILEEIASQLGTLSEEEQVALLLDPTTQAAMARADERPFCVRTPLFRLEADRTAARFASWYELFPRSQTDDAGRHGTFDDVIKRLPAIRAMGFDVLYLTPIHPIGEQNRKGRNNSLTAAPGDPGSPYAIGSKDGGHDAIHPELGTIHDFRRLRREASRFGFEIALDFAIQCAPDHPWLAEHPGWFAWRPDGSLKYAENPPKKYEDIVNVDFYAKEAVPELWLALRDIVLYWVAEGVRIFRVDNPHTKPLPFWQWLIAEVRGSYPDVIFLSEAFTRPKMMYRLAQVGFSQSYTYFTWRTTKRELTDYLVELTTTEAKEYFRPHFFVNTPDINPFHLQTSGRAGFLARAALAATLSGLWGMYSGFELLEAEPIPGREEYLHSEKYEIKPRDWNAPGSIIPDIARLNRLRKAHPALQTHLGLAFYTAHNERIIYYGKATPERDEIILVAVNLDPHAVQEADFEIPLWEWGLPDHAALDVEDLIAEHRFVWRGKMQHMRLDPHVIPYAIWRVQPHRG